MTRLVFCVVGEPVTQGSKRAFLDGHGRPHTTEVTDKVLRPWRAEVASAALEARQGAGTIDGPVAVELTFYLARPASYPKRVRLPWKGRDVDKLARAVLDSLTTAQVYRDDSRVTDLVVRKRFAAEYVGVRVEVEAIDETEIGAAPRLIPPPEQLALVDIDTGGVP
jgi:crossover junction endodeoxyribonuclease RusA